MINTSFISNDSIFSGYIMLALQPKNYDWVNFITELTRDNNYIIKEPEFNCHVTIAAKIHKDDVINFDKRVMLGVNIYDIIKAEQTPSYFNNELLIAKFAIKDSVSLSTLFHYRNEVFCHCRCLETYPNYQPHITIAYLYKNNILPKHIKIEMPNEFLIKNIMFSIENDNKTLTW